MTSTPHAFIKDDRLRGTIMVAVSGMLYGMIGYFGMQLFYQHFSVPTMLFWRFFIATLWMFVIGMSSRKRRALLIGNPQSIVNLAYIAAISYSGGSAFFYLSSLQIGTGPAMVLFYAFPIFVVLFSFIFDKFRMNRYVFLSLAFVMCGLVLLNGRGDHALSLRGVLLGLVAAFFYGVYVYSSHKSTAKADSHWLTLLICLGCTLIFLFFSFVTHSFIFPGTLRAWVDILVLGIVATAIPIQLLLTGLKYISSIKASILSMLEPIVTVLVGMVFLNESMVRVQVIGVAIILLGALAIQFEDKPDCDLPLK